MNTASPPSAATRLVRRKCCSSGGKFYLEPPDVDETIAYRVEGKRPDRRAETQRLVDEAVERIEKEYPAAAGKIAELAALAADADAAARSWTHDVMEGRAEDLRVVDTVATRLGWPEEFIFHPDFADAPVLPPVGQFCGFHDERTFITHVHQYALHGGGAGSAMVWTQQDNGPRWGRI